tara:strand:- start:3071 stop:5530 length:2460 start_codon:yes stop_codon:yes gene_type:complete
MPAMNEESVFLEALEIESSETRARFLDSACRDFPGSRAKIEQLLESHSVVGNFLLKPPVEMLETALSQLTDDHSSRGKKNESDDKAEPTLDFLESSQREGSLGRLGTYEVLELVAHGGTGIVLRATDTKLHRDVALKVLKPHCLEWPNARANFLREARAAAAIRSDHVVTVFAVEDEHSVPFLAMEFIEGESLQQKLDREGPFSIASIIDVGSQIAAGLAVAHSQDLIHRDIKPANILIENETGRIQITDFGLARAVKESGDTLLGLMSGTPQYMSPEQAEGKLIDHRSDLFSLGSVLYVLTTGLPPFRSSNSLAVLRRVVEQQPRALNEARSDLQPAFVEFVERLLEKSPDKRPQSADEIVERLSKLAQNTDNVSSVATGDNGNDHRRRKWLKPAMSFMVAAVSLAVIVLIVKNRDGQSTKFIIPEGSRVNVDARGEVVVNLANVTEPGTRGANSDSDDTLSKTTSKSTTPDTKATAPKLPDSAQPPVKKNDPPPTATVPFSPVDAQKYQTAWARHLGIPTEFSTEIGLTFSLIPPGEFDMGSTQSEVDALMVTHASDSWVMTHLKTHAVNETPQHRVRLSQPFFVSQTEVTVQQFRQFVEATDYKTQAESTGTGGSTYSKSLTRNNSPDLNWKNPGYKQSDEYPVVQVTWQDAVAFCEWASEMSDMTVTLPTEAQWEFACRAGSNQRTFFGKPSALLQEFIVRASPYGAKPVATMQPNVFGLFDIYSNVWEWCSDNFEPNYDVPSSAADTPLLDPTGPAYGKAHVIRGGSYRTPQQLLGSACRRLPSTVDLSHDNVGFRVVITGELSKVANYHSLVE